MAARIGFRVRRGDAVTPWLAPRGGRGSGCVRGGLAADKEALAGSRRGPAQANGCDTHGGGHMLAAQLDKIVEFLVLEQADWPPEFSHEPAKGPRAVDEVM